MRDPCSAGGSHVDLINLLYISYIFLRAEREKIFRSHVNHDASHQIGLQCCWKKRNRFSSPFIFR